LNIRTRQTRMGERRGSHAAIYQHRIDFLCDSA